MLAVSAIRFENALPPKFCNASRIVISFSESCFIFSSSNCFNLYIYSLNVYLKLKSLHNLFSKPKTPNNIRSSHIVGCPHVILKMCRRPRLRRKLLAFACSLPLFAQCFAACSSLFPVHTLTLSDSRPHDDPPMCVITGACSGRCGHPLPRPLIASGTGTATVPRSSSCGSASSSPKGEAVIMMPALRANSVNLEFHRPPG